jgi:glycosyltransferase involved in cell wall biosynthesis
VDSALKSSRLDVQRMVQAADEAPKPLRVLVLHASAAFGGASKSLVELLSGIPRERVAVTILCPGGAAAERFGNAGMEVIEVGISQFDNTRISFYRGLRWIILLREIALLPGTLLALWRLRRREFDLVHANEITIAPVGVLAKIILSLPLVVHVRSVQRGATPRPDLRTRWLFDLVRRHADAVVPIDETVKRSLPADLPTRIIHNTLSLQGTEQPPTPAERVRVGFVGNFLPFKGIHEFVQAARLCRDRGLPVEFVIAGDNPRSLGGIRGWLLGVLGLARDLRREVQEYVQRMGLEDTVRFTGFVDDVAKVYSSIDILCFATHLDAPGRPVLEAAFYGIPSIVAVRDPLPDTIVHGQTGICIDVPEPERIADAIEYLCRDPVERARLGRGAKDLARRSFDRQLNAAAIHAVYDELRARKNSPPRLVVHAPNVHVGGGRELLAALMEALQGQEALQGRGHFFAVLDERFAWRGKAAGSGKVVTIRPTLKDRFEAEWRLKALVPPGSKVLCFGNLPPLFRLRGKVFLYLQNRFLLDDEPLVDWPWYARARLALERSWLALRLANVDVIVVQTHTMRLLVHKRFRRDAIVAPFLAGKQASGNAANPRRDTSNPAFLYVASGEPHKNHRRLVHAWRLLGEAGVRPALWLTLDRARYSALVTEVENAASVHGLHISNFGNVSRAEVQELYANASALIYPSTLESYGLPLLEARSAGLPLITAELDYVRDIVDPAETFDPRSSLSIARAVKRFLGRQEKRPPGETAEGFLERLMRDDAG